MGTEKDTMLSAAKTGGNRDLTVAYYHAKRVGSYPNLHGGDQDPWIKAGGKTTTLGGIGCKALRKVVQEILSLSKKKN